jgi:hypothetical protein
MANRFNEFGFSGEYNPTDGSLDLLGATTSALNLGANANVVTDGEAKLSTIPLASSTPGGANQQVQFNNNGLFSGIPEMLYDNAMGILSIFGATLDDLDWIFNVDTFQVYSNALTWIQGQTAQLYGTLSVNIDSQGDLNMVVQDAINIIGSDDIIIAAQDNLDLSSGLDVTIQGNGVFDVDTGSAAITTTGQMVLQSSANQLVFLASDDIFMSTGDDFNLQATNGTFTATADQIVLNSTDTEAVVLSTALSVNGGCRILSSGDLYRGANPWITDRTVLNNFGAGLNSVGGLAGIGSVTGELNAALGTEALGNLSDGDSNTALGYRALWQLQDGSNNIGIGYQAGSSYLTNEVGNICIGHNGSIGDNQTIRVGTNQTRHFAAGVTTSTDLTTGGVAGLNVLILPSGQLGTGLGMPIGWIHGAQLEYVDAETVNVQDGSVQGVLGVGWSWAGNLVCDMSVSGAGGLDVGAINELANTTYFVYAIYNRTTQTPNVVFSTNAVSPSLPAGYTDFRVVGFVRNDSSSDFLQFKQTGWSNDRWMTWQENASNLEVLSAGAATSFTTVSLSSFLPGSATSLRVEACYLQAECTGAAGETTEFRETGDTSDPSALSVNTLADTQSVCFWVSCGSGSFQYRQSDAANSVTVRLLRFHYHLVE